MAEKHVKSVRRGKRIMPLFFFGNAALFSWFAFLIAEPVFNIKYLPSEFPMIALYCMLAGAVLVVFIIRRLGEIDPAGFADLPEDLPVKSLYWISVPETLAYTVLPGVLAFGLHALNTGLQFHKPQTVRAEVVNRAWHKRNTDDPENAWPVHMVDVAVDGIDLHGRTLSGTHRIQIEQDIWDDTRKGDVMEMKLNTGALGWVYSVNIDGQRNLMR